MNKALSTIPLQIRHLTNSFLFFLCHTDVWSVRTVSFFDVKVTSMCAHTQTHIHFSCFSCRWPAVLQSACAESQSCSLLTTATSGTALPGRQKALLNCKPLFLLLFSNSAHSYKLCLVQKPFLGTKWNLQKLSISICSVSRMKNQAQNFYCSPWWDQFYCWVILLLSSPFQYLNMIWRII